jgi:hypothetical protein
MATSEAHNARSVEGSAWLRHFFAAPNSRGADCSASTLAKKIFNPSERRESGTTRTAMRAAAQAARIRYSRQPVSVPS